MDRSKLLIVDDEPGIIEFITDVLSEYDHEIFGACDGEKALSVLKHITPDLIIIDWEMPRKNGIETVEEIKKIDALKHVPVIMITGRMTSMNDLKTAFDAGVVDFIRKPFIPIELIARTKSMLLLSKYYKETIKQKDWELTLLSKNTHQYDGPITDVLKTIELFIANTKLSNNYWYNDLVLKIKKLKNSLNTSSWSQFENHFKNVHPKFTENLLADFPKLTNEELKLACLLRLNMNSKEIAAITNKEAHSIDIARYRLRKKLNLEKEEKLHEILMRY